MNITEATETGNKLVERLNGIIRQRGITIAEICRRANLPYELIRRSLHKERLMKVDEFVSICKVLEIELNDFTK